jgi:hypothetical protein
MVGLDEVRERRLARVVEIVCEIDGPSVGDQSVVRTLLALGRIGKMVEDDAGLGEPGRARPAL